MDTVRDDILYEVDVVQKLGMPGRIIVIGSKSVAIITGKNEEDVILAAGEIGKGRICAFTHGGYGKQLIDPHGDYPNSVLYRNVRNWVANRELSDDFKVLKLDESKVMSLKELKSYDFVLSLGAKETTPVDVLEEYLKGGGGLVYATTPWGWLQLNPDKKVYDVPYGKVLSNVGLFFSKNISEDHGSGFAVELSLAENANLEQCLDKNKNDINALIKNANLISEILDLPPSFQTKFKKDLQKSWTSINDKLAKTFASGKIRSKNKEERNILDFWFFCSELQPIKTFKACGISEFPGDFDKSPTPELSNKTVTFSSDMENFYFSGCYLPAGYIAKINVTKLTHVWTVMVGAHTDVLTSDDLRRWPTISFRTKIFKPGTCEISSPFGGGIYFLSPTDPQSTLQATINGTVTSPRYDSITPGKPWKDSRKDPGLWADISGKYLTITMPSDSIRILDDPSKAMELYDQLLKVYNDLRGTDIDKNRTMWVVCDIQPSCGYMHAGYPIVTELDVADPKNDGFLLNAERFKSNGFWGLFHEIGHNMQQDDWTFHGTGEVTVNIFTLYGMHMICRIDAWNHPWLRRQTKNTLAYLRSGADFNTWKREPGVALYLYAQLVHSFTWEAYKRVFRRYQALQPGERPRKDQDKIDLWFLIFSKETKFNLLPIGLFWGVTFSDLGVKNIEALKFRPFLPDDDMTDEVPDRVKFVKERYPNLIQSL